MYNSPKEVHWKRKKKKKKEKLSEWDEKVNEQHMKIKYPMQPMCFLREENNWYVSHPKIKLHPKNAWQSLENPLAYLKCVNHMLPNHSFEEFQCLKRSLINSKTSTLTPWL